MTTEIFSKELDYSTKILNASTSVYRDISTQASGDVVLSSTSSVGPSEFIIPSSVLNLSKSRLNFTFSHNAVADKSSWCEANLLSMISRVVCYDSSSSAVLLDVSNFEKYCALTTPVGTKLDDFLTKSVSSANPAITIAAAQLRTCEDIQKVNATSNYGVDMAGAAVDLNVENKNLGRRQKLIGGIAAAFAVDVSIPLSAFKFTALALDKQIYCPSNLVLQIYFNPVDNFLFQTESVTSTATVSSLPVAANPSISNLKLAICNEGNLSVVGQVIETVMKKGLSFPIGYPTTTRQSIAISSAHAYQLQLTRGYGQRILGIVTAPFSTVGIHTANVHARGLVTHYNTYINNISIKYPNGFDCTKSTDYMIGNKEQLKDSAVQTLGTYAAAEWLHSDGFTGDSPLCRMDPGVISGLDVSNQSSTWSIQADLSANAAYTWVTAIIGQKVLTFSSQGSSVQ